MNFRKNLSKKLAKLGISDDTIPYTTLGFLQLLGDQLEGLAEQTRKAEAAMKEGREAQALEAALPLERMMADALFSHKLAMMLFGRE